MPCKKCEDGKYKWGDSGDCQYDTLEDCENAHSAYKEMKETKIIELIIDPSSEDLSIDCISLVSAPALEENMVYMSKAKNNLTLAKIDSHKRELIAPALIPDKNIYRYNAELDSDYYVYFSKETVKKCAYNFLKNNNHHKASYEHQERVSGVLTVESWIKEGDSDKSKLYGFDLPNGSWFVKMAVQNEDLWKKIVEKNIKGLSIEGFFTNKFESMQEKEPTNAQILKALNEIIRKSNKKS